MQTLPAEGAPAIEPGRPAYRPFRVRVVRVERLTPAFRQVTVAAPDLRECGDDGLDQRIKLLLPTPGTSWDDYAGPDWYARWRDAPDERRPVLRTYTVRRVRRSAGEVDIVLEDMRGRITGIEVKAAEAVSASDFKGLYELKDIAGDKWTRGIILHSGKHTVPFQKDMHAVPLSALWEW